MFRSFDMDYPDAKRTDRFLEELAGFEKTGEMPRLVILRLPNDHTSGTSPGKWTVTACVGDNDLALGRLVEGLSKSRFWKQMAIFVVEDDAQNGSDHVDAHRTVALAISPYIKRHSVDSTLYSTSSMLRTMELILGLEPMSQFDAAARPMFNSFTAPARLHRLRPSPGRRRPECQEHAAMRPWPRSRCASTSRSRTAPTTCSSTRSSGRPSREPTPSCRRRSGRPSCCPGGEPAAERCTGENEVHMLSRGARAVYLPAIAGFTALSVFFVGARNAVPARPQTPPPDGSWQADADVEDARKVTDTNSGRPKGSPSGTVGSMPMATFTRRSRESA